jgi:hypothetical protein
LLYDSSFYPYIEIFNVMHLKIYLINNE